MSILSVVSEQSMVRWSATIAMLFTISKHAFLTVKKELPTFYSVESATFFLGILASDDDKILDKNCLTLVKGYPW